MSNTNVLITGGASGIGLAVATRLVEKGKSVHIWDVSETSMETACMKLGPLASGTCIDISDSAAIEKASQELAPRAPTHLVNNAGILGNKMTWNAINAAEVMRVFNVNVLGLMNVTSSFLRFRTPHPTAAIVNMSSIAGQNGGATGFFTYGASKGAIDTLTRSMAIDLAPEIRVNAIAPGVIETDIQRDILTDENLREKARASIPLARLGQADEAAKVIDWLLFDAGYTTGEVLRVAGGRR